MSKSKGIVGITIVCIFLFILYIDKKRNETVLIVNTDTLLTTDNPSEKIMENITAKATDKPKVYITGEVVNPGVYEFDDGERLEDAICKAGGFTAAADKEFLNLAEKLFDTQRIIVYNISETAGKTAPPVQKGETQGADTKININTATKSELTQISGIGDVIAEGIISYRGENGEFKSIDEIKNVNRIGDKLFDSIKNMITVD